jgi:arylsulfatase A-like enzyme
MAQDATPEPASTMPNILYVMVDQLRPPMEPFTQDMYDVLAPNLSSIRRQGVEFSNMFTVAAKCSPSRACLMTGTYTHQNGMLLTNLKGLPGQSMSAPSLSDAFPTYGTYLRDLGYETPYFGKWHITDDDHQTGYSLERFGFSTTEPTPSPTGAPGEGFDRDDDIASLFIEYVLQPHDKPWCATVSFVNPHDIAFYPKYSSMIDAETPEKMFEGRVVGGQVPSRFHNLPENFETPVDSFNQGKPSVQRQAMWTYGQLYGGMPYFPEGTEAPQELTDVFPKLIGAEFPTIWHHYLDLYAHLIEMVDVQIGRVLNALASSAAAKNTIIVFTADHGEFLGSHGMRGKGVGLYDEGIRVPFYVYDPTGALGAEPGSIRDHLAATVDIAPFLMTLAAGNGWRNDERWAHLSNRLDVAGTIADPSMPGREYIVSSTDEEAVEFGERYGTPETNYFYGQVPQHGVAVRTKDAKMSVYSFFEPGTITPVQDNQHIELYDYTSEDGFRELVNRASSQPDASRTNPELEATMLALVQRAMTEELEAPLPGALATAREKAMADYFTYIEAFEAGMNQG